MSLPEDESFSLPEEELPPARRRQLRRMVAPLGEDAPGDRLAWLGKRVTPGAEFYLTALLAGLVAGVGFLLDSPAVMVLAVLLAPFMGPALGLSVGTVAGSLNFLARTFVSLLIGGIIFLLTGSLAGWVARIVAPPGFTQLDSLLALSWPGVMLVTVGSVISMLLLARNNHARPQLSSVALAYTVYLPLAAAGFGLTSGAGAQWEAGILAFISSTLWAALTGSLTLILVGLHPRHSFSYVLIAGYVLLFAAGSIVQVIIGNAPRTVLAERGAEVTPTQSVPRATGELSGGTLPVKVAPPGPTVEPPPPTPDDATSTPVVVQPTLLPSPTNTLVPTRTPTATVTPQRTPVWARINAKDSDGAVIRVEPSYNADIVTSMLNGILVEVMDEVASADGTTWVRIVAADGKEGWIVRYLLATATPAPGW